MTPVTHPAPHRSARSELRLALQLEAGSVSGLLRVFSILHRRRCRVIEASFRSDADGHDELVLCIDAPEGYVARVEHWLRALVDVHGCDLGPVTGLD